MLHNTRSSRLVTIGRGIAGCIAVFAVLAQNACAVTAAAGAGVGGIVGVAVSSNSRGPVEVRFKEARELAVSRTSGRADTTYSNVLAVFGTVRSVSGDTTCVVASELRLPASRVRFSRSESPTAIVVRGEGTRVRRLNGRMGSAVIGAAIGGAVGGLIGLVIMLSGSPPAT
jgi:hypothetical protein